MWLKKTTFVLIPLDCYYACFSCQPTPPPLPQNTTSGDFFEAWTTKLNWSHAAEFRAASDEDWKLDGRTAAGWQWEVTGGAGGGWDGMGWDGRWVGGECWWLEEIPRPTTCFGCLDETL